MSVESFWKRVRTLLKKKKLTQAAAARACGRPLPTFKGWMSKNILPSLDSAFDLAKFLDVNLEYLITGKVSDKPGKIDHEVILLLNKAANKLTYR